jgi:hypothetical protein
LKSTKNKNLFQNLENVKAIAEISDKAAATCAGGYSIDISGYSEASTYSSGTQPISGTFIGYTGDITY